MRFLVDMPLSPMLARWLVERGHDAVHATSIGMSRAADSQIMVRAVEEGRTIVTADLDYPRLLAITGQPTPSVILLREGNWSEEEVVDKIGAVLATMEETEIAQSIVVVEKDRIRRRRLPL